MLCVSVKFCPIASGSSGNSIYIGTKDTHILIDVGISGKKLIEGLEEIKIDSKKIDAIFLTHEHKDHVKGAGIISIKYNIPIYATIGTWESIKDTIGYISENNKKFVYSGENCVINDMCLTPFNIPHDANEPVGYNIFADKYKMTVATDIGHITDSICENLYNSDVLLIEANHDEDMLRNGSYTWSLKQRILSDKGHISNETAGKVIVNVMTKRLKHIFLGHLSNENNRPYLAYETVEKILNQNNIHLGKHLKMDMAARYSVSRAVELN